MKKTLVSALALSVASFGFAGSATAQVMDYAALQKVFGEPVTTNATGTPQRASDVAANMTIITADQIRQSGLRNVPQIIGEYVSGVDILQGGTANYDVGVRGYLQASQPRLLVLVDGRQVFIDDYSRTIWDNIPVNIDDIRQIEVVKGPTSALFGSNAASGVINIITYSPIYDNNNVASASVGTQNFLNGDATITKNGNWGGTKSSVGGFNVDEFNTARYSNGGDSPFVYAPYHRYATNSSVFKINPDLTANTEFTYSVSRQNAATAVFNSITSEKTETYSARGGLSWQTNYGQISMDNYFNHSHDAFITSATGGQTTAKTDLFVSSLNDQFEIGSSNTFRAALEFRHKDFDVESRTYTNAPFYVPGRPRYDENNYAVSGTWLAQLTDDLSFTNSLRADHQDGEHFGTLSSPTIYSAADFNHSINTWSANSALVYKVTNDDTLRATYGRGVQLPSLFQASTDVLSNLPNLGGVPLLYEGNPQLKPTITQAYELGYDHNVRQIHSTVKLATFYQSVQDVATLASRGLQSLGGLPTVVVLGENIGNSKAYGAEIGINGKNNGFRWDASYSYSRVTDSDGVSSNVDYQGSTPQHHLRVNGGYTYKQWEFDSNAQFVSSTNFLRDADSLTSTASNPVFVGSYYTLGGRVGYNINDKFTAAVSGTNLTRNKVTTSPFPSIERQAMFTVTGKF